MPYPINQNLRDWARKLFDAGLNVLPAIKAQKRPVGVWKPFTETRPAFDEAFPTGVQFDALCVVCGKTSGGLEILDFDQKAVAFDGWKRQFSPELSDLLNDLPTETTQSGGRHVAYRCPVNDGNKKLANNAKGVTIETRGQGGICLIAPSPDYELIWGDWLNVPTITPDDRTQFWNAARACDESPKKAEKERKNPAPITPPAPITNATTQPFTGDSVADLLRDNLDIIRQALTRAGWESLRIDGGDREQWRRPDQPDLGRLGGTLYIGGDNRGCFHCFTSNAAPLEVDRSYSPLQLIAALEFGGDESAASKEYAKRYGLNRRSGAPRRPIVVEAFDPFNVQTLDITSERVEYKNGDNPFQFYLNEILEAAENRKIADERRLESVTEWELVSGEGETTGKEARENDRLLGLVGFLPEPIQESVSECALGFDVNRILVLASEFTIFGAWLGHTRAKWRIQGRNIDPAMSFTGVGDSGAGKSPLMEMLIEPGVEIQKREATRHARLKEKLYLLDLDLKEALNKRKALNAEKDELDDGNEDLKKINEEIGLINAKIAAIKAPPQTYFMKLASPQGVVKELNKNAKAARTQNRNVPTALIFTSEGARIFNVHLGAGSTADQWAILNDVADGGINNASTKDETDDKEYSVKAAFYIGIQGTSCTYIKHAELRGSGLANRINWCYLDYRYGFNPYYADPDRLEKRRRLIEAIYEWGGANFISGEGVKEAFSNWRKRNKERADDYRRKGEKETAAYLRKNEGQILRVTLWIHCIRQFWELVKDDNRTPRQWERLLQQERRDGCKGKSKAILEALDDSEEQDDILDVQPAPASWQNWNEWITSPDGNSAVRNPRLIIPLSEFKLAAQIIDELELERKRTLGIVKYQVKAEGALGGDDLEKALEKVLKKVDDLIDDPNPEKPGEYFPIPVGLEDETRERLDAAGITGVYLIPRRNLAQTVRAYRDAARQKTLDPLLKAQGRMIELGAQLLFIEYDDVQEEPIDATPQDVISLNGVDRASQSNRRIEKVKTFPEF